MLKKSLITGSNDDGKAKGSEALTLSIVESQDDRQNSLFIDKLLRYHLVENHLPTVYQVIYQQTALLLLALVGLLYASPAEANSANETEKVLNIIGTCFTACIVPCSSTMIFYEMHVAPQYVPDALQEILVAPLSSKDYIRQNIIIGFFSLLSAVPFATVAFAFDFPLDQIAFVFFLIYVLIANTLLHFLPVKLTLADPIYGALPRFIYNIACYIMNIGAPEIDIHKIKDSQLKTNLKAILKNAVTHFLSDLTDKHKKPEDLLLSSHLNAFQQLVDVLSFYKKTPNLSAQSVNMARVLGVITVCGACIGYLANPYLVFVNDFGLPSWAAILCTLSPMYFLGILLAFWGDQLGQRLLANIMLQGDTVVKLSVITKLYPKIMPVLMLINLSLVYFSAAAGVEMTRLAFQDLLPQPALMVLYVLSHLGIGLIGWYAPLDYEKILLGYLAQYGDTEPHRSIMIFKTKYEVLIRDIDRLKPEYALELVQILSKECGSNNSDLLEQLNDYIIDRNFINDDAHQSSEYSSWSFRSFFPCLKQENKVNDEMLKSLLRK